MRRSPVAGIDLRVYLQAVPLLVRNPAIVVVPLLALIAGVLIREVMAPYGGGPVGSLTFGIAQWIALLLALLGLGSAAIMGDDAWRRGRASFDAAWTETQRRTGEILTAAIGMTFVIFIAQYVTTFAGTLGLVLMALAVYFLIWTIPAAAVGGIPGGAAIQASIDRVRSAPMAAAIVTVVTLVLVFYLAPIGAGALTGALAGANVYLSPIVTALIGAVLQAIAVAYVAVVLAKSYTDAAFGRRFW
jgi:hypothetical protein